MSSRDGIGRELGATGLGAIITAKLRPGWRLTLLPAVTDVKRDVEQILPGRILWSADYLRCRRLP